MTEENTETPEPLARAEAAYAAGDFARVRAECAALGDAADPELRAAARALASRVTPGLAAWLAFWASTALLVGIVVTYAL